MLYNVLLTSCSWNGHQMVEATPAQGKQLLQSQLFQTKEQEHFGEEIGHSFSKPGHCWGTRGAQLISRLIQMQLIHLWLPTRRPAHTSQRLYVGNWETAFLQKSGLVMSFLATDPCICHSSRVKYEYNQQSSSHCVFFHQPWSRCCQA